MQCLTGIVAESAKAKGASKATKQTTLFNLPGAFNDKKVSNSKTNGNADAVSESQMTTETLSETQVEEPAQATRDLAPNESQEETQVDTQVENEPQDVQEVSAFLIITTFMI